jgi:Transglutaminase-like superfamily
MYQNQEYNLSEFLQETRYCDCGNPAIMNLAHELTRNCSNDIERAIILFEYVRDNILYGFGEWGKKASTVLTEKRGMCTNSANLLVALLRSTGIPSGYGVMKVDTKEYFGPIMLPIFKDLVSEQSVHIYVYVYLNNKWVRCDPSVDKVFSEKTSYFSPTTELLVWNGLDDRVDSIDPKHIYSDSGPFSNIDDKLDKKPRGGTRNAIKIGNLYLDFLRENTIKVDNIEQLQPMFLSWLKIKYPVYYMSFLPIIRFKSFARKTS